MIYFDFIGYIMYDQKEYKEALQNFNKALEIDQNDPDIYNA